MDLLEKADEFLELSIKNWLWNYAFAVDTFSHMNELNVKLQGRISLCTTCTNVKAFKSKLAFFSRQILNKTFTQIPIPSQLKETGAKEKKYSAQCTGTGCTAGRILLLEF